ncbi:GtrA family protein [Neomegalonema sp.]|uniref:GtrA family protein n=1 Tax=Neomegalonema sp. TaxID=2039713 RepID=UPI00263469AF|nr:GtrA family protein [Neomegalonema sp.]MDD2867820.1 GtrA family protein [Neomegalonema sp.]
MTPLLEGLRFTLVGIAATLCHLFVAFALLAAGMGAERANLVAFLVAFLLSFRGHSRFSFQGHGRRTGSAFARFSLAAGCGFAANQAVLLLATGPLGWSDSAALIAAVGMAAAVSFALNRLWSFRPVLR